MNTEKHIVIVAGGKGLRLGAEIPKQFVEINGLPILMHTINVFRKSGVEDIVLVLPESHFDFWENLCQKHHFQSPKFVAGGKERFHSVRNGINALANQNGIVGIHDAVRPFVNSNTINQGFEEALNHGSAIPFAPVRDTLRQNQNNQFQLVNRNDFILIQTPQFFNLQSFAKIINETDFNEQITDDASVYEGDGNSCFFYEGNHENIKITFASDLLIAKALLGN